MGHEFQKIPLQRLENDQSTIESECIVKESIISLHCIGENGDFKPHTSLLGTPTRINELHIGHLLCEGLTLKLPLTKDFDHNIVNGKVYSYYDSIISNPPKPRLITTSCGACNHPDLFVDQLFGKHTSNGQQLSHDELRKALDEMSGQMKLFEATGGCHGAALLDSNGKVHFVSEDIGRHNAVDKTIGSAVISGVNLFDEFTLLLSGRCGWDIVAKATRIGIPNIASVGAFSSAALDLARENGISLYGFVRKAGAWKAGIN